MLYGGLGTVGAFLLLPESGGGSAAVLPLTTGEFTLGLTKVIEGARSSESEVDMEKPTNKASSLLGVYGYSKKYDNAEYYDAVGSFLPGVFTGGNIMGIRKGIFETAESLQKGKFVKSIYNGLGTTDAILDTYSLAKPPIDKVIDIFSSINSTLGTEKNKKIQTKDGWQKIQVISITKTEEIRKFLESL